MLTRVLVSTRRGFEVSILADEVTAGTGDPGLSERLAGSVQGDGAFAHLEALQAIADREGGNRASGTRGYDASEDFVADTLRRAGFVVRTPTFTASAESDDEGSPGGVTTRNVVAGTATGRAREVVLTGAHLDSVPGVRASTTTAAVSRHSWELVQAGIPTGGQLRVVATMRCLHIVGGKESLAILGQSRRIVRVLLPVWRFPGS